ncbi:MAG: imidazole glycerol phosphate synthase subunit HisF, partial [Candidatus Odinarchaeota archaeon]
MIAKRIIPLFLLKGKRLVKGANFTNFVDVGDPLSQALIYDAQGAEEIIIVDIEASLRNRIIDTAIINNIITRCRLPIGVGGGIQNLEDARKCFNAGADKIAVNTHAMLDPSLIKDLAAEFGSQSVLVSLDVKKNEHGDYDVYIYSGKERIDIPLKKTLDSIIKKGAGEIILTSIDKEGTLMGFDYDLYKRVRGIIPIPLIASGGAGSYEDMVKVFRETNVDALAVGKMLFLRDYDIIRFKAYLRNQNVRIRDS